MKDIKVVIGANFGDEGKGLMTDYFASKVQGEGIVVRFNGGAQAGHTVTTIQGQRHVFGHFGAGSFAGLSTFLSSFFVVNPMLFIKELEALKGKNVNPKVLVDANCIVTTPYDVMINQIAEITRGGSRHGSCGVGFNETIVRNMLEDFKLCVCDLANGASVREKLRDIKYRYLPERLGQLKIENIPDKYAALLDNEAIIESYICDIQSMMGSVEVTDINILQKYDYIVFEGAQGLLLDQNHRYFPYLTRSNTGMQNVRELLEQAKLADERIEIVYVTRAYMTRHGAGPFPTEVDGKPYPKIEDLTNIPNDYQGLLRFGLLDINILSEEIQKDLKHANGLRFENKLAVTCLDQLDGYVDCIMDSKEKRLSLDEFYRSLVETVNVKGIYKSFSKDRENIIFKS